MNMMDARETYNLLELIASFLVHLILDYMYHLKFCFSVMFFIENVPCFAI
jgi:hypothetical protein